MSGLTKKQQAKRVRGIGASEIAVLVGLSKWASPIQIYERKLGIAPPLDSYAADLGIEIEAPIARVWAKQHGRSLALVDTLQHRDPKHALALATPDRAVYLTPEARGDARVKRLDVRDAEKLLQVKSTNWRMRHLWGDEGSDFVPDEYLAQAHWEGSVAGLDVVEFAVDFDKTKLHTYRVKVSADVFGQLYAVAERFWVDHVLARKPPPPDASDAYAEHIARAFPRETSAALELVDPSEDVNAIVAEWAMLKAVAPRVEKRLKALRASIALRIGGAAGIKGEFGQLTYKATRDSTVTNWKPVAEEAMRIAALVVQTMPEGDHRAALAEDLKKLVSLHTVTKPGYRTLKKKLAEALMFDGSLTVDLPVERLTLADGEEVREGGE